MYLGCVRGRSGSLAPSHPSIRLYWRCRRSLAWRGARTASARDHVHARGASIPRGGYQGVAGKIRIYLYVYISMYVYMYIYICIYTHTHIYILRLATTCTLAELAYVEEVIKEWQVK